MIAATAQHTWTALVTEDGEPFAAFVHSHCDVVELSIEAEPAILKAFAAINEQHAADARELLDESGGAVIARFWLRKAGCVDDIDFFEIARKEDRDAFPVTGVRFQ